MMAPFEYDIAISFAEEDRNAALALTRTLALNGLKKVYYYPDFPEVTTGRPLKEELMKIYCEKAKYAIALLSKDYFKKDYARLEMEAIKTRMAREKRKVYLIPVLMKADVLKLKPEVKESGYLEWDANPDRIAQLLVKKLGAKLIPGEFQAQNQLIDAVLAPQSGNIKVHQRADEIVQANMTITNAGDIHSQVITNNAIKNGK